MLFFYRAEPVVRCMVVFVYFILLVFVCPFQCRSTCSVLTSFCLFFLARSRFIVLVPKHSFSACSFVFVFFSSFSFLCFMPSFGACMLCLIFLAHFCFFVSCTRSVHGGLWFL